MFRKRSGFVAALGQSATPGPHRAPAGRHGTPQDATGISETPGLALAEAAGCVDLSAAGELDPGAAAKFGRELLLGGLDQQPVAVADRLNAALGEHGGKPLRADQVDRGSTLARTGVTLAGATILPARTTI